MRIFIELMLAPFISQILFNTILRNAFISLLRQSGLLHVLCICLFNKVYTYSSHQKHYTGKNKHIHLTASKQRKNNTANGCGTYLR